ncbi:AlwI family type II restriction endonuclease [Fredinandcohnia humi]
MFEFKSYSWVVGTTSFRVKEINYKIEQQLIALKELFEENPLKNWRELQVTYYEKLHEKGLLVGNAKNKAKDAREKTSGLKELGLITEHRKITEVGSEILNLLEQEEINDEQNEFMIEADALIYLKQLLKLYVRDSQFSIRPFVALLYMLDKLDYLTEEEFTFLLPLCKNNRDVKTMVKLIQGRREGKGAGASINSIILHFMNRMPNYRQAREYFIEQKEVTVELICAVGMNRKSREGEKMYDAPYFDLYQALWESLNIDTEKITEVELNKVKSAIKQLKKPSKWWRLLLLGKSQRKADQLEFFRNKMSRLFRGGFTLSSKKNVEIDKETAFRNSFYTFMHLYKWKANLEEYGDLNKRYFSLADILIFQDEKVELTLFAKYFFHLCVDQLIEEPIQTSLLNQSLSFEQISPALKIDTQDVVDLVSEKTGKRLDIPSMREHFKREKDSQLEALINHRFSKEKLVELFTLIESRNDTNDKAVQSYVTENADIPTIFEYLLGVSWYHISGKTINLMDSWNMSLDANLLPKRHAAGGGSDIVIDFDATTDYPNHKLMLEATLTNATNQRRAEMEPVSRHLGTLKAANPDTEIYGVFVSNHLDINVVIDFRSRKDVPYFDRTTGTLVKDNMIIPVDTENIKTMLSKDIRYSTIYRFFKSAYTTDTPIERWYEETINAPLKEYA